MSEEMMKKISSLKRRYEPEGFNILGVFGSWARADQTPESDIDILYETADLFEARYSGWDAYSRIDEIRSEIQDYLGLKTDLANLKNLDTVGRYFILPEVIYVA
jgi:predicted nucleotidyltransferase